MIAVFHAKKPTFGFGPAGNFPGDFNHVADVDLPDEAHSDVFRLTNHIDQPWWENPRVELITESRSTSVGDMIRLSDGRLLLCKNFGWSEVTNVR
jgi:hypothetical protein